VLDDGTERGIRVLEFRTGGGLRFDVLVDRAMDIGLAEFDDLSVGWRSATGFRHPALHEVNDEDGLSWLRSMSGLLVSAGRDHTLFGGEVGGALGTATASPARRPCYQPIGWPYWAVSSAVTCG